MSEIRLLKRTELNSALDLVWKVFWEFEAVNYAEESRQAFYDAIHSKEYLDMLTAYGAFDENELIGIIAGRNEDSHVALFFVDGEKHRQGIGRRLWDVMRTNSTADVISVHSSKYAFEVYKKLGFKQTGDISEEGGIIYIPMEYPNFLDLLKGKDDNAAYAAAKRIAAESEFTDKYYKYIPEFVKLLDHKKSYIRTRALILCCSQARWDEEGMIGKYITQMLRLFHDDKPAVVRQSLNALKEAAVFRPELCETIAGELEKIDLFKYKESMSDLIQKDISGFKDLIGEIV